MPIEVSRGRQHYGEVGPDPTRLFNTHHEGWSLMLPPWLTCVVLSGYFPARCILIQISTTPSDMGETCSLCSNVEVSFHYVHMRFMIMFNYNCLVVKNDDTKNG
jgi:hypothetical protein